MIDIKYPAEDIAKIKRSFEKFGCAQIYDSAMEYCQRIELDVTCVTTDNVLAAPVYPVNTNNDMLPCIQALEHTPKGWCVFLNNTASRSEALAGDIYCTAACSQGLAGIVINGAIRDIDHLDSISIPVYAREITFQSAKTAEVPAAELPQKVNIDDVTLSYGDWIFADSDGMLVVKREHLSAVFASATILHKQEERFRRKLESGERLSVLIGLDAFLRGEQELRADI
ncbi:RraA family protein [Vibrio tasmaniensis]|uniref:RraA family protein n=1 Tax=Vibrio tasmaniensis TaxID=212663 RepID=UPI000C81E1C5|nr:RraA family protein [Vibrio tasmaniensis]